MKGEELFTHLSRGVNSVFSLNFSSAGKGPFMASNAKNMPQRCTFPGGGGYWSERHGPTLRGAKFFEMSFTHFKTYFMQIGRCYL